MLIWTYDLAAQTISAVHQLVQDLSNAQEGKFEVLIVIMIGIFGRAFFLSQPMRYDEAFSFLKFVNRDLINLFYYPLPNNHILHNIFVKLSIKIWGVSPESIRFPAFIVGIALIPLVYLLCRSLNLNGLLASIIIACSPYLILYSTNSRGYGLLCLLTVLLIRAGLIISREGPSLSNSLRFSFISAMGMLTIPSMLYAISGVFCWILALLIKYKYSTKKVIIDFILPSGLMIPVFSIILYTPAIFVTNGVKTIISNRFIQAESWKILITEIIPHIRTTILDFYRDIPTIMIAFLAGFAILGFINGFRNKNYPVLFLFPGTLFGTISLFILLRNIPFARTWIFYIPIFAILADAGYSLILKKLQLKTRFYASVFMILGISVFSYQLVSSKAVIKYPDTGNFPDAEICARWLETFTDENDRLYAQTPADWPIYFYLYYYDVPIRYYDVNGQEPNNLYYIVQKSMYSLNDLTKDSPKKIFDYNDVAIYEWSNDLTDQSLE